TTIGFTAGILNPINTGLGQAIADLEPFSGKGLRVALFVALLIAGSYYVTRYARRVKRNPEHSLIHAEPDEEVGCVKKCEQSLVFFCVVTLPEGQRRLGVYPRPVPGCGNRVQ